ncbi:putative Transmembrane protein [Quillaja saponaria]|uniref:Transmembrane protein n=1 Tax=Quillaja saponaria TaxID=32244 RepID=A0AAD7PY71_QUISA|nr:putative Transmembrane protein [Quillaja saponaria]
MENSMGAGFMAVFAVSGSMLLLIHQVHKRLLSDFMRKFEFELGGMLDDCDDQEKHQTKKKVRFAHDVLEPSSDNKDYRKRCMAKAQAKAARVLVMKDREKLEVIMPLNRLALYKGIIEYKTLKGHVHV